MKPQIKLAIAAAWLAMAPVLVSAQQSAVEKFADTCRWSEGKGVYVNKTDGKPCGAVPAGVPTKEQIRAEREKFLANNKWSEGKGQWMPLEKPRAVCADKACDKTRDEVRGDAKAFEKTHRWSEGKGMYVPVAK